MILLHNEYKNSYTLQAIQVNIHIDDWILQGLIFCRNVFIYSLQINVIEPQSGKFYLFYTCV